MSKIKNMLFVYIALSSSLLFAQESWRYAADFAIGESEPLGHVNLASLKFINPSKERTQNLNIIIKDTKGEACQIKKFKQVNNREAEILFTPSSDRFYTAYIKESGTGTTQTDENLRDGKMLIEDFVPVDSTKTGQWNWVTVPRMSGSFSITGKEGTSFQRVLLPSPEKIEKSDKLVVYLYYMEEKPPEEIMVELTTIRDKIYLYSWGQDLISADKGKKILLGTLPEAKKISMGSLPESGRWIKMEIPFTGIKENMLSAVGLYHYGGRVWWDRVSINEVPMTASITTMRERDKKVKSYFNYSASSPLKLDGKVFQVLKVDASPSSGAEAFSFTVSGKKYAGRTMELLLMQGDDRKISLEAECQGIRDTMEYEIPRSRENPEEIKMVTKVLPYQPFVRDREPFTVILSVTNLNNETVPLSVKGRDAEEKVYPQPGETKHVYVNFSNYKSGDIMEAGIYICGLKLCGKTFRAGSTETSNISMDGPFMTDEKGNFMVIDFPGEKGKKTSTPVDSLNITLAGSYPDGTGEILQKILNKEGIKSVISETGKPEYGYNQMLFSEYLHIVGKLNLSENGDIFILFPYTGSIEEKTPPAEWQKAVEAIISAGEKQFSKIIICSPFPAPPFPELYTPYKTVTEEIACKRSDNFLDVYSIYLSNPDWRKLFIRTEGIYKNLPEEKGVPLFIKELVNLLNSIFVKQYQNGTALGKGK